MNQERISSESASVAILVIDQDFSIQTFNEKAQKLFLDVFSVELKKEFQVSALPEFFNATSEYIQKSFNDKLSVLELKPSNNSLWNIHFTPYLDSDNSGKKASLLIEERKQVCSEQSNPDYAKPDNPDYTRQIYENLFHNNPDAIFSFDLRGNFVDANESSAKLAEVSREKLFQMNFLPFVLPEDQDKVLEHFEAACKGKSPNYSFRFISDKGTRKILHINNFPIYEKNKIIGVYGIAKDITAEKNAENKIIEERKMLRAIIDNIPDYIFVKDRDHKSILSNRKFFENILGKDEEKQSKGYTPLDYLGKSKGEEVIEDNEKVMRSGEAVINRPDFVKTVKGKEEIVLLTKVPLKNEEDEIIGLVGIARDITETYLHNKKQDLIFKIIKAFGDRPGFQEATLKTLSAICKDLGFDYAESFKVSADNNSLIRTAFWPKKYHKVNEKAVYDLTESLPGMVCENKNAIVLRQSTHKHLLEDMIIPDKGPLQSAVGLPIIFQDKLISIVCLGSLREEKKIDKKVLEDIALQIAPAMESKRSQNQLNDFFHFSPNLIGVIGFDGFIKKINPVFEYKFGFSEAEILTQPFLEFIHPADRERTFEAITNLSIEGSDFEIRCLKKDGNYLWISWRFSQFFQNENVIFIYGTDITPVKDAYEELQVYKNIIQNSRDGIAISDLKNKNLYLNESFKKITGYSIRDIEDQQAPFHLISNAKLADRIEEDLKNSNYWKGDIKILRKNDELIDIHLNAGPVLNDNGELTAIYGLFTDISERKNFEREIQKNRDRLQAAQDIAGLGYWEYNTKTEELFWTSQVYKIWETQERDFKPSLRNVLKTIYPEDHDRVKNAIIESGKTRNILEIDFRILSLEGTLKYITQRGHISKIDGNILEGSVQDTTNIKLTRDKAEIAKKQYELLALATQDIIYEWDLKNDFLNWGHGVKETFGHEAEEINTFKKWARFLTPGMEEEIYKDIQEALRSKESNKWEAEYEFRHRNGEWLSIFERGMIIRDIEGKAVKMIGALQDISKLKQSERKLKEANDALNLRADELMLSNKELEQFAYIASHDLQEPLRMVSSFLTQLQKRYNDQLDERAQKYIYFAHDGAIRMRRIILDLLEYSRVGRKDYSIKEIDLNNFLPKILELIKASIREKNATIKFGDLPVIQMAELPLQQVLLNLISNGMKYQKTNNAPVIDIKVIEKDSVWEFQISDNGIGIDPQFSDKIFIIFQRLHNREDYSGTGIGLAICKKIVNNYGGDIWVEPGNKKGSVFHFTLAKQN